MNQRAMGGGVLEQLHLVADDLHAAGEDGRGRQGAALEDVPPQGVRRAEHEAGLRGLRIVDELGTTARAALEPQQQMARGNE